MKPLCKFVMTLMLCCVGTAFAHDYKIGPIEIDRPWSRATVAVVPTGVVYLVLHNHGTQQDRLLSVSTPVAEKAELHTHIQTGDMLRMQRVDAIDIAPTSTTMLTSGGLHIMLMGLKQALVQGRAFPLTLVFEKAGTVTVQVDVQTMTDTAPARRRGDHDGHAHHRGHKK